MFFKSICSSFAIFLRALCFVNGSMSDLLKSKYLPLNLLKNKSALSLEFDVATPRVCPLDFKLRRTSPIPSTSSKFSILLARIF